MFFAIIVIGAIVLVLFKMVKQYNNESSNSANRPQNNQQPQWSNPWASQNRQSNTNQNPNFNSHLCDDNQHVERKPSSNFPISYANTTDKNMVNRRAPLSKYETQQETSQLRSLLDAGIITPEEYFQRKNEL